MACSIKLHERKDLIDRVFSVQSKLLLGKTASLVKSNTTPALYGTTQNLIRFVKKTENSSSYGKSLHYAK
jgi:hypothetical protein